MPLFKVGDPVERIDGLVSPYAKNGVITRVFQYSIGKILFTEYEVKMVGGFITTVYETELRLVKSAKDSK
jgi:hypothetical protein